MPHFDKPLVPRISQFCENTLCIYVSVYVCLYESMYVKCLSDVSCLLADSGSVQILDRGQVDTNDFLGSSDCLFLFCLVADPQQMMMDVYRGDRITAVKKMVQQLSKQVELC